MTAAHLSLVIFIASYAGIALGAVPGLALDRTGVALLGAIAMVATGSLSPAEAGRAVDIPTILILYSLMVVSAQFRLGGFYTRTAIRVAAHTANPPALLFLLMSAGAGLSALLANDIVCFAFTPVICVSLARASLRPAPFLIGLACASNIGSAATIIGNPQNMLIGQVGGLHFGDFMLWCAPPSLVSLLLCYLIVWFTYRGRWRTAPGTEPSAGAELPAYDAWQSRKALCVTAVVVALFFTTIPRELTALGAAGVLLCSRRVMTRTILGLVDWHLITLFCSLFVIIAGVSKFGIPGQAMERLSSAGVNINEPPILALAALALSNVVSNVPAVMLILKHLNLDTKTNLYLLALVSTYAGNLFLIGSIANLITFEQARHYNIRIGFLEHARVGIPVTAASVVAAAAWFAVLS